MKLDLAFFVLLFLSLIRFALIPTSALDTDEAYYAQIISEIISNPQLIPHYLGNPESLKPPVAFLAYAPVTAAALFASNYLPISLEFAFRFAPAFFAALSVFVLYFLLREFFGKEESLIAAAIFAISNQTLTSTNTVLLDSALLFFILLALLSYAKALSRKSWLLPAAVFSFLAALTKTYVAFIIPVCAFALFYYFGKENLRNRNFLLSLLAVPFALVSYALAYALLVPNGLQEIGLSYLSDGAGRLAGTEFAGQLTLNAAELFKRMFPFSVLAIFGAALLNLRKPQEKFLAFWSGVSLISLANQMGYFWYYLPAVPPLAMLASRAISRFKMSSLDAKLRELEIMKKLKINVTSAHLLFAFLLLSSLFIFQIFNDLANREAEKQAGLFLHGKSIVSFTEVGMPIVFFYANATNATQFVADATGIGSYSAFANASDIFLEKPHFPLANATSQQIKSKIPVGVDALVFSKKYYDVYATSPSQEYPISNVSCFGDFVVVLKS